MKYKQKTQLMQNALNASSSTPIISPIVRESVEKALEILEDSPTGSIFKYMCYLEHQQKNYFQIINYLKVHCVNYLVMKLPIQS